MSTVDTCLNGGVVIFALLLRVKQFRFAAQGINVIEDVLLFMVATDCCSASRSSLLEIANCQVRGWLDLLTRSLHLMEATSTKIYVHKRKI
jgi:hypothetical protein